MLGVWITFLQKMIEGAPTPHLYPDILPIIACLGTPKDFTKEDLEQFKDAEEIDTDGLSPIDSNNKTSNGFLACAGIIVAGKSKKTGKNISFITHQEKWDLDKRDFIKKLNEKFSEIKTSSISGTIDAVIFGGDYFSSENNDSLDENYSRAVKISKESKKSYAEMVKLLGSKIKENLGFEPVVINGPKKYNIKTSRYDFDTIYYDNSERRLYFIRPQIDKKSKDILSSRINEEDYK